MILQPVTDIAEICARLGLKNVVLSPGSRCAPLTIAFARHPEMLVKTVSDERAAAFTGLGMAQISNKATVLVCTSGTAAYNYAPAIAEAFYQQIPLLILTADRPNEWVDQQDGQTIRQTNIYQNHIKQSFTFPADFTHPDAVWHAHRLVSEAINLAHTFPFGPVHINIPLREPFYPNPDEVFSYTKNLKIIRETEPALELSDKQSEVLKAELQQFNKILIVAGQQMPDEELQEAVTSFCAGNHSVLVSDVISNFNAENTIKHQDVFLNAKNPAAQNLHPDLLITFGKSVISKNLKLFLRKSPNLQHWHIQPAGQVADTFQALTKIIRCEPVSFFRKIATVSGIKTTPEFAKNWQQQDARAANHLTNFFQNKPFNEFSAYWLALQHLPENSILHVANSMAVRYANLIGLPSGKKILVTANRGTSGIDGCTSTTVGNAWESRKLTTIFTGDLAFFYDRNGLWHNYLPANLRIIVFNNQGGGIFRLIDGPSNQPELDEYFETRQVLQAENTARDFGMKYFKSATEAELVKILPEFYEQNGAAILEIMTENLANATVFKEFKNSFETN
ncbi:2-succinyl-5-enolpyruvyl-6-hydroxy-3-cyclohexene-1-carboxylic-acid synthase [Adhaeribacter sp. BT258]|uniref:2-succinyl-5-enolpyruvyl-6-hydroxy-3-cyclohexene-1-carboxylate synthase n=1 Tax=Adhaeribacter terrigena TaxID=2793070 RepID=A0ABS1C5T0_9BACT|nr:2-succinyl-5-enolpyruvyl-6-hydroxy-3-cyclohexene-1-carboxylic-acid synthase [Adhaeribacter terrigena]MBK0404743.1 2-succinyl-5-enolpyruvyl-6-hydroxy-3-cyclohexene-1-carboxylic-acid synthase [Adhaeribacter terrigena]